MSSELLTKVDEGEELVNAIESFLIFPMSALDLAIMARCVRTSQFVTDSQEGGSVFKQGQCIALACGETVGKLEAVVCLDAFDPDAVPCIPGDSLFEEVGGRKGALLVVSA